MLSCSAQSDKKQTKIFDKIASNTKYYSSDSLLIVDMILISDSMLGNHCFTSFDGNRIDCCIDSKSLFLKRKSNDIFNGFMVSCYDDKHYPISIEVTKGKIQFIFVKDDHEFMPMKTTLFEEKKK